MKKLLVLTAVFALTRIGGLKAQEFKLTVVFSGMNITRPVTFGYDLNASDSMTDSQWGELYTPPFIQPGDLGVRMRNLTLGRTYLSADGNDGGPVDIRRKPPQNSFELQYEIYETKWDNNYPNPVSMAWDNTSIPTSVKHIYLSSEDNGNHAIRLDMKTVTRFDIPDSQYNYSNILITLLYDNGNSSVHSNDGTDAITVFPNPIDSRSKLHFMMSADNQVMLSVYDITGRKMFNRTIYAAAGENTVELSKNDFSAHSGIYLIRLTGLQIDNTFQKTATIIVQ
jgi:hypothetical protein